MGWWKLEAWKEDSNGNDIELDDADLEHIAGAIKEGYTQGEVVDGDEQLPEAVCDDGSIAIQT